MYVMLSLIFIFTLACFPSFHTPTTSPLGSTFPAHLSTFADSSPIITHIPITPYTSTSTFTHLTPLSSVFFNILDRPTSAHLFLPPLLPTPLLTSPLITHLYGHRQLSKFGGVILTGHVTYPPCWGLLFPTSPLSISSPHSLNSPSSHQIVPRISLLPNIPTYLYQFLPNPLLPLHIHIHLLPTSQEWDCL